MIQVGWPIARSVLSSAASCRYLTLNTDPRSISASTLSGRKHVQRGEMIGMAIDDSTAQMLGLIQSAMVKGRRRALNHFRQR
jgi:hypothetical protein